MRISIDPRAASPPARRNAECARLRHERPTSDAHVHARARSNAACTSGLVGWTCAVVHAQQHESGSVLGALRTVRPSIRSSGEWKPWSGREWKHEYYLDLWRQGEFGAEVEAGYGGFPMATGDDVVCHPYRKEVILLLQWIHVTDWRHANALTIARDAKDRSVEVGVQRVGLGTELSRDGGCTRVGSRGWARATCHREHGRHEQDNGSSHHNAPWWSSHSQWRETRSVTDCRQGPAMGIGRTELLAACALTRRWRDSPRLHANHRPGPDPSFGRRSRARSTKGDRVCRQSARDRYGSPS